ncbi:ABC transporter, permease component [Rhodococcus rhodnii LMG 5362]|uniref:ABC transporter, permease component n=1 Tax=Rhodococcus rhodnii LMG 5362 TaxID=1273125 RepID=R7WNC1_9NOCA|nr:ABC transporter, permease component [Rhodococcus rhodnii LMG 5362]
MVLWELLVRMGDSSGGLLVAAPTEVLTALPGVIEDSAVMSALGTGLVQYLAAMAVIIVLGVAVGMLFGQLGAMFEPVRNVLQLAFAVPQVAISPLFIVWLGVGFASKFTYGITQGIIPVLIGMMTAAKLVDRSVLDSARSMGASSSWRLRNVVLPAVVPDAVSNIRIASKLCLLGILQAELMVSTAGIGSVIRQLSTTFQPDRLYATVLLVCVAAVLINSALGWCETRASKWRGHQ